MSVTVRHLNGDSSFLLLFSPEENPRPSDLRADNGAFSVLIDPWIVGSSVTTAPWFAITHRVEPSSIQHLSELESEPDVVICSQNKTDHTNKETLLQLRPEAKTLLVAEPAAAKTIKSWNHFNPNRVQSMARYDARSKSDNILRLVVPPLSAEGDAGLITIAFVPAKNYVTGLHNAFGITYQPPTRTKSLAPISTVDLHTAREMHRSTTNLLHPCSSLYSMSQSDNLSGHTMMDADAYSIGSEPPKEHMTFTHGALSSQYFPTVVTPPDDFRILSRQHDAADEMSFFEFSEHVKPEPFTVGSNMPTPPASPLAINSTRSSSISTMSSSKASAVNSFAHPLSFMSNTSNPRSSMGQTNRSKTISIIYSPHGLPLSDLQPYIQTHLVRLPGALPLTLLLHSFDYTTNPWYLGGNITTGAEGGAQIASALMARCWISAHDAEKDKHGVAVKMLKMKKTDAGEVKQQLQVSHDGKAHNWSCDIRHLAVGQQVLLSTPKKQVVGLEIGDYNRPYTAASSLTALSSRELAV